MPVCNICAVQSDDCDWLTREHRRPHWGENFNDALRENWELPSSVATSLLAEVAQVDESTEKQFHTLADRWSRSTGHISSIEDLTSDPSYQQIINLGWEVVPFLLLDLQKNKRFWFLALTAITRVRPFDPSDAGNGRRMTDAWVQWGKRKGLI